MYHWTQNGLGQSPTPASGPSQASEQRMVQNAVRRGACNVNHLTDLVFHARHPERRGARLARHERTLQREWVQIRDGLVLPVLGRIPLPPQVRQFLDRIRQNPANHEKFLLSVFFYENPLEGFVESLPPAALLTRGEIQESRCPNIVVTNAVIELQRIFRDHQLRNTAFNQRVQAAGQLLQTVDQAVGSISPQQLEPYLVDILLAAPQQLWEVGLNFSQNRLPSQLARRIFESDVARAIYSRIGQGLRRFAEQRRQTDANFRNRVEQERRRREEERRRREREPVPRPRPMPSQVPV